MEVSTTEQQAAVERFKAAIVTGDVAGLLDVLAPDVVMITDGGGLVAAVRDPTEGPDRVAALLASFSRITSGDAVVRTVWLNGEPALRVDLGGELDTAISLVIADGRVSRIYAVRNPQKLSGLEEETRLRRTWDSLR
jgi:RNA polymerase sigma-70 factor (ECF subfamily)